MSDRASHAYEPSEAAIRAYMEAGVGGIPAMSELYDAVRANVMLGLRAANAVDADRFLREKIAALTGEQLLKIARGVEQSGGLMMQWPSVLRTALRETFGVSESTPTESHE